MASLKECLSDNDMSNSRGIRPVHSSGTRFVSHKVAALDRIIDRFGTYIGHLVALSHNPSVKATDQEKLKGYVKQWRLGKSSWGVLSL